MQSATDKDHTVELVIKVLRVSGLAGLVGFLLATAIGRLGADQPTVPGPVTQMRASATIDARSDRSDADTHEAGKADLALVPPR
jgi:hypothetical protein